MKHLMRLLLQLNELEREEERRKLVRIVRIKKKMEATLKATSRESELP